MAARRVKTAQSPWGRTAKSTGVGRTILDEDEATFEVEKSTKAAIPDAPPNDGPTREQFMELRWDEQIMVLWPHMVSAPFSRYHREAWEHLLAQEPGKPAQNLVFCLPRGAGKSATAEMAAVFLGLHGVRLYILYVSGTQASADTHVENVADLLEAETVAYYFPEHADRAMGKYGTAKGWRRNRLQTAGGLTIDAAGLDAKVRGLRRGSERPSMMVFDDLDEADDGQTLTNKRWSRMTASIMPAGRTDGSTLAFAVQNLVKKDGVMDRIMKHRDGVFTGAKKIGPIPALFNVEYDEDGMPIGGIASWPEGQPLEVCQAQARQWGTAAYRTEAQHDFAEREGAMWKRRWIAHDPAITVEDCLRVVIGYDPAISDSPGGDEHGIVVAGLLPGGRAVVLEDRSGHYTTNAAAKIIARLEEKYGAEILFETNQGKDHVRNTLRQNGCRRLRGEPAKGSKEFRAMPVADLYEESYNAWTTAREHDEPPPPYLVVHVQPFDDLEGQMVGWVPEEDPDSPDRVDALVIAVADLVVGRRGLRFLNRNRRANRAPVATPVATIAGNVDPMVLARQLREQEDKDRRSGLRARYGNARRSLRR